MKSDLVSVLTRIDNFLGASLQARVPPTVTYSPEVIEWLGSPEDMEAEFADIKTDKIPDDYLKDVEKQFENIGSDIVNGELYGSHSHVIFGYIFSYPRIQRVVLAVTYVRPCAEKCGFLRLLLYQIARVAYAKGFDMHIDAPYPAMLQILTKAFGVKDLQECAQEQNYVGGHRKGFKKQRYVVDHADLEGAITKLGVASLLSGTPAAYPSRLQLKRDAFPTADKLNNG